jgi:DNA-directed RNA polymerase subunit RPC12/RpoP
MKHAKVEDGAIKCGHCGSVHTIYAEDVTNEHELMAVRETVLVFHADVHHIVEDSFNDRIVCKECGAESLLPERYDTIFE